MGVENGGRCCLPMLELGSSCFTRTLCNLPEFKRVDLGEFFDGGRAGSLAGCKGLSAI